MLRIGREMGKRTTEAGAMSSLSYGYGCLKQHQLALEYAKPSLAIACEINHQQHKRMALASLANTSWYQSELSVILMTNCLPAITDSCAVIS